MSLKRLTGLFKRKSKAKEEQAADQEERQALIGQMSDNFQNMGNTMEQVQDQLSVSNEAMQELPELIREHKELCRQVSSSQEVNQGLLTRVQEYFEQRDHVQQEMIDQLHQLKTHLDDQSKSYHDNLQKLSSTYKSGRRMLVITIAIMGFIGCVLLTLLLVVALRPDLLGVGQQVQTTRSHEAQAIDSLYYQATQSDNSEISARAHIALEKQN